MKRTILAILVLSIFIHGVAHAGSATVTGIIEEFSLRNGITFGMTKEQVKSVEEFEVSEDPNSQYSNLKIKGSIAGIDDSSGLYIFDQELKLKSIQYCFSGSLGIKPTYSLEEEYQTIEGLLSQKYGSPMSDTCIITSDYFWNYLNSLLKVDSDSSSDLLNWTERLVQVRSGGYVKIEHWDGRYGLTRDGAIEFTDHFVQYTFYSDQYFNSVINQMNSKEEQKKNDL